MAILFFLLSLGVWLGRGFLRPAARQSVLVSGLAAAAPVLFAGQSLRLDPGQQATFSIPDRAPYQTLGSFRIETRVHNWFPPSNWSSIFKINGVEARVSEVNGDLLIYSQRDTFQNNQLRLSLNGLTDFVLRVQRNLERRQLSAEIWHPNGSLYRSATATLTQAPLGRDAGVQTMGGPTATYRVAFLHWYSTLMPIGSSVIPHQYAPMADLGHWSFEGNTLDSSAQLLNISFNSASFVSTPAYAPVAAIAPVMVVRAGHPFSLDASGSFSLSSSSHLNFLWEQRSGPSRLAFDDATINTPTIDGTVFGSYDLRLTVTDDQQQQAVVDITLGAVATDDQGVVIPPRPEVTAILGPAMRWGASPWPWFDDRHMAMANRFIGIMETAGSKWDQPMAGTISLASGSKQLIGAGTSFQQDFCNGGTEGTNAFIVIWFATDGGGSGRWPTRVVSCPSDTQIVLADAWDQPLPVVARQYARLLDGLELATWVGPENINYYDTVLAFYSLYYRTGIERYRNAARLLADLWWRSPWIDQGRSCTPARAGKHCLAHRFRSMTGLIFRAIDGHPEMWPGLRLFLEFDRTSLSRTGPISDIREQGYTLAFTALGALFDPSPSHVAAYNTSLLWALNNRWAPQQESDGSWRNLSYGFATWNGHPGTVTVTNGSRIVQGTGTNWQPSWFNSAAFWSGNTNGTQGDPFAYVATYVSPTELMLDRPYTGGNAAGRGWQLSNLVGVGTQPFMLGILGSAFRYAYLATNEERFRDYTVDIANWISQHGYRPATRGLWYGRYFANCEPIAEGNRFCAAENVEQSRILTAEVLNAFSYARLVRPSADLTRRGDDLFGAMFGKLGGPGSDQNYLTGYNDNGFMFLATNGKWFGFMFGFSFSSSWPAARIDAGTPDPIPVDVPVAFDLASVPDAESLRLTVSLPNGGTPIVQTCTSSPCTVSLDKRLGTHLGFLAYLDANGRVIREDPNTWIPLRPGESN